MRDAKESFSVRQVTIRVPADVDMVIARLAEQEHRTRANMIVELLRRAVEKKAK